MASNLPYQTSSIKSCEAVLLTAWSWSTDGEVTKTPLGIGWRGRWCVYEEGGMYQSFVT